MKKNSRIYIAGHRGMVGSSIMRILLARGYTNIITCLHSELDLTRQAEVEKFFEAERPEYVFFAAAKVGGILANSTYKAEFIYENTMIAANIIYYAYKYDVKKLLNLGSSCIYPKFADQPIREESLLSGVLEETNEPYAMAKITAVKLCRYFNEQYGTNFMSAMPTNLYGPHDNFNLETAHVLPALMRKLHLAKLMKDNNMDRLKVDIQRSPLGFSINTEEALVDRETVRSLLEKLGISEDYVMLWGNGEPYREFLHVDDLADACYFVMEKYDYGNIGECVNIGTGEDLRIRDLALLLKEIIGFEGDIRVDLSKPGGTPRKLLDISKIESLGWRAKTGLREGIIDTYKWYRDLQQTQ
jgi:GDP-L-fucose synthase